MNSCNSTTQGDKADNCFTESEIAAMKKSSMGPKPYHSISKSVEAISQLEDRRLDGMMKSEKNSLLTHFNNMKPSTKMQYVYVEVYVDVYVYVHVFVNVNVHVHVHVYFADSHVLMVILEVSQPKVYHYRVKLKQ